MSTLPKPKVIYKDTFPNGKVYYGQSFYGPKIRYYQNDLILYLLNYNPKQSLNKII